ncbi:hypothetical protein GJ496_002193 [Pomphorhynchus laevis]|nr:hypothetical protein GJ496_002193 [Pomphorhynchus laevis]
MTLDRYLRMIGDFANLCDFQPVNASSNLKYSKTRLNAYTTFKEVHICLIQEFDNQKEILSQSCQHSQVVTPIHRTLSVDQLDRAKFHFPIEKVDAEGRCDNGGTNPVDSAEGIFFEGFLCPICKCDLGRPDYLQVHFQRKHSSVYDEYSSAAPSFDFKSFLTRAKNKVLQSLDTSSISNEALSNHHILSTASYANKFSSNVDISHKRSIQGQTRRLDSNLSAVVDVTDKFPAELRLICKSQTRMFLSFRSLRASFRAKHSEQILSRLQKLTLIDTDDFIQRRIIEKHITQWTDDRDVNRCPDCSLSFGILRRKHHCRLCGFVLCHRCSWFLSIPFAVNYLKNIYSSMKTSNFPINALNKSVVQFSSNNIDNNKEMHMQYGITSSLPSRFTVPTTSNMEVVDSGTTSDQTQEHNIVNLTDSSNSNNTFIRLCKSCRQILKSNYELSAVDADYADSHIISLYRQIVSAVDSLKEITMKSIFSMNLCMSSPDNNLPDRSSPRTNNQIAMVEPNSATKKSSSFLSHGIKDKLERSICLQLDRIHSIIKRIDEYVQVISENTDDVSSCSNTIHIQKTIVNNLKQYGLASIREGINCRSQLNQMANKISNTGQTSLFVETGSRPYKKGDGEQQLTAFSKANKLKDEDKNPIIEQIAQVKKFIQSAKQGQRYDEVWALEANLRELQILLNS